MSAKTTSKPDVISRSEAAARLGLRTPGLVALIRKYRYGFTELAPGGKPGDRGRNRWGLTEAQLQAIIRGQSRQFTQPDPESSRAPISTPLSPDGRSRLRGAGWPRT